MPLETVFDEIIADEKRRKHRKKRTAQIAIIIIASLFNTIVTGVWGKLFSTPAENLKNAVIAFIFTFNIVGVILGTIIAIFPYKYLRYDVKFSRASLITMMFTQLVFTLLIIINFIYHLMGYQSMFNPGIRHL